MAEIDRDKLYALASDPDESAESISQALGLGKAHNLHYHLNKNAELKRAYNEGREIAGKARKPSVKAPRKSSKKSATPPRKTNAKGGASKDLLMKVLLEFDHMDVYGSVSEHFDELREAVVELV